MRLTTLIDKQAVKLSKKKLLGVSNATEQINFSFHLYLGKDHMK